MVKVNQLSYRHWYGQYMVKPKGVSEVTTWEKVRPKDYQGVMVEVFFQKENISINYQMPEMQYSS